MAQKFIATPCLRPFFHLRRACRETDDETLSTNLCHLDQVLDIKYKIVEDGRLCWYEEQQQPEGRNQLFSYSKKDNVIRVKLNPSYGIVGTSNMAIQVQNLAMLEKTHITQWEFEEII